MVIMTLALSMAGWMTIALLVQEDLKIMFR
jgi:hypothetical protein